MEVRKNQPPTRHATATRTWSSSTYSPSTSGEISLMRPAEEYASVPLPPLVRPVQVAALSGNKKEEEEDEEEARSFCPRYVWTASTLTWLLPLVVSACLLITSFLSPDWLAGPDPSAGRSLIPDECRFENLRGSLKVPTPGAVANASGDRKARLEQESIGLAGGCHINMNGKIRCLLLPRGSAYLEQSPPVWRVSVACFAVAGTIVLGCLLLVLVAPAKPDCRCLPLFGLAGLLQGFAVIALAVSLSLFPVAWNSRPVRCVCGKEAHIYSMGLCTAGWPIFVSLLSLILIGFSAIRAANASKSMRRTDVKQFRQIQAAGSCLFINDLRRQHLYNQQPHVISY